MSNYENVNKLLLNNYQLLSNKNLPKTFGNYPLPPVTIDPVDKKINKWREKFVNQFGYCLYSEDWIKPLAEWIGDRKCLEVQAGSGMFSYFLTQYGVKNIKVTDNFDYSNFAENQLIDIEQLDFLDAIKKYGTEVDFIILSWPTGIHNEAYQALKMMREVNPNCKMIYIGPTKIITTPNFLFLKNLQDCSSSSFREAVSHYQTWISYNDKPLLVK